MDQLSSSAPVPSSSPRTTFVLLPSPFLGPAVWGPVAVALAGRPGVGAVAARGPAPAAADPAVVLTALLAQVRAAAVSRGDVVLVAHSSAGLFVPALVHALRPRGAVFVDAVLPPPTGAQPVAPQGLRDLLRDRVGADGLLPPWTRWWPEEDVAPLFPDAAVRRAVEAEQRRVPFAYLEARVPVPDGWDRTPGAYLAFGDTYAEELADARGRGWPTRVLDGLHLHQLQAPGAVADAVLELLEGF